MSNFTNSLKTEWLPKERWYHSQRWKITESYDFYMRDLETYGKVGNVYCHVAKGTISDLASIPWALRWLIPKVGLDSQAAVVHDCIYKSGTMSMQEPSGRIMPVNVSRHMADRAYKIGMDVLGVSKVRSEPIYRGLRMGGFVVWNRYRAKGK